MLDLRFPHHSKEKLEELNYYYKVWFGIVKRQKCYIIDAYAGTGYVTIEESEERILGSALLAVDLFKKDIQKNLDVVLININPEECKTLRNNIESYLLENKIDAELDENICVINNDWSLIIEDLIKKTENGISFFLLDPYGIESLPWEKLEILVRKGKSQFGYKESGFEVLINWAWHKIRRDIGIYYKLMESDPNNITVSRFKNLNAFFGPINWKNIVDKYPTNIFKDKVDNLIDVLMNELVKVYAKHLFDYFKYIEIHPVNARKKGKRQFTKERGKVKYFLIFASNYYDALDIIDKKFKEYREIKIFSTPPKEQTTLEMHLQKKPKVIIPKKRITITIRDKLKKLNEKAGIDIFSGALPEKIIKFLYFRKNYDYGCYDFVLFKKFEIDSKNPSLKFLRNNEIIGSRKKQAKSGSIFNYYYLTHPVLVDRGEYLFFNEKVYEFKDNELVEF